MIALLPWLLSGGIAAGQSPPSQGPAEVMFYNGKIITMNPAAPIAEALTIVAGRILAVGSTQEVGRGVGPKTRQIDLGGRTVLPGLIDSHVHPISAALSEAKQTIPVVRNFADLKAWVRRLDIESPGEQAIVAPKVYSTRLAERRYPTREEIDSWVSERPVILDNGYAAALNSAALERAGIRSSTPEPADGKIIRNPAGEPTGLILGARSLVSGLLPRYDADPQEQAAALTKMQRAYNRVGLTSVIDRSLGPEQIRVYQRLWSLGELTVRTFATRTVNAERPPGEVEAEIEALGPVTGFGDEMLRVGSLKIFLDGGILIGTAYLRSPYGENTQVYGFEDPDYRGVLRVEPAEIAAIAKLAARNGWQMTAHSTGGGSTDALLDAYEAANREIGIRDRRFTITHANFLTAEAIDRARTLGVVLDIQPAWLHFDAPAVSEALGEAHMRTFQPLRSIFDAGVIVAGGSDHMIKFDSREAINPYNPFFGMWMAITRQTSTGEVVNPDQRISREQALEMWTTNAAYLSFEEEVKGSLEAGKYADLVVIDRDILTCPVEEIRDIDVVETILGGKTVYRR